MATQLTRLRALVALLLAVAAISVAGCGSDAGGEIDRQQPVEARQQREQARQQAARSRAVLRHQARVRARRAAARRTRLAAVREQRAEQRQAKAEEVEAIAAEEEAAEEETGSECDPSYSGACLDPYASDYDCEGGSGDGPYYTSTVTVVGEDHYGLDSDSDGWGCEP